MNKPRIAGHCSDKNCEHALCHDVRHHIQADTDRRKLGLWPVLVEFTRTVREYSNDPMLVLRAKEVLAKAAELGKDKE